MSELSDFTVDFLIQNGIDPNNEVSLVTALTGQEKLLVHFAVVRLMDKGTLFSLPALKKALHYPASDVKISALHAIAKIAKDGEQETYLAALNDPKYPEKMTAISQIEKFNDVRAVPSVIERLRKILSRKRLRVYFDGHESEVTLAVKYLAQFKTGENADLIRKTYAMIQEKWPNLELLEQQRLVESHTEFRPVK